MSYDVDELLPLSGVQHLVFCERQAALIHVEGVWADNALTVDGRHRHDAVHNSAPRRERRGDLIIVRGLDLRSMELGLAGYADVVEFHRTTGGCGVKLPGTPGAWVPFPVEYKRGRPKPHRADEAQLCAQAICLEEMLGIEVSDGALFYGRERRRTDVVFDNGLRDLTARAAKRFRQLVDDGLTPPAVKDKKCDTCSLLRICLPQAMSRRRSARHYLTATVHIVISEEEEM